MMNSFDVIDNETNEGILSSHLKLLSGKIALWVRIVAITNIAIQGLNFITAFFSPGASFVGSFVSGAITVSLYASYLQFGNAMKEVKNNGTLTQFEKAMAKQKIYWQFFGILLIIGLCAGLILLAINLLTNGSSTLFPPGLP